MTECLPGFPDVLRFSSLFHDPLAEGASLLDAFRTETSTLPEGTEREPEKIKDAHISLLYKAIVVLVMRPRIKKRYGLTEKALEKTPEAYKAEKIHCLKSSFARAAQASTILEYIRQARVSMGKSMETLPQDLGFDRTHGKRPNSYLRSEARAYKRAVKNLTVAGMSNVPQIAQDFLKENAAFLGLAEEPSNTLHLDRDVTDAIRSIEDLVNTLGDEVQSAQKWQKSRKRSAQDQGEADSSSSQPVEASTSSRGAAASAESGGKRKKVEKGPK